MAFRAFADDTSWDTSRRDVRYTAATLEAVAAHEKQAQVARLLLTRWDETETVRQQAEDEEVASNALVALIDFLLDNAVAQLAQKLRGEHGRDDAPGFRRYFPEAPSEVIRLGLESELARVKSFHIVATEHKPSSEVAAVLEEIKSLEARGQQALERREKAAISRARASLRIQAWKEEANSARRSVANQLEAHAIAQGLPADYADRFFPAAPARKKKKDPLDV